MKRLYFAKHLRKIIITSAVILSIPSQAGEWMVGAGMYDITGPAADRGMVGYGSTDQTTKGIHTRLWSRAFTIGKPGTSNYLMFVSADIQSITQGVHQGVLGKIANDATLSPYLNKNNVMLTATHTHVGPGGYDHTAMLNMSALGYDKDNYNVIVDGIYQSIVDSFNSKTQGEITIAQGTLSDASMNRGENAYVLNDDHVNYSSNVNDTMTLLKMVKDNGDEVGLIDWFAVHNVSASQDFRLISGDNKGVASQLFETLKGTQPPLTRGFVAAFANSEEGDVSPNICGPEDGCGATTQDSILLSANKQFNKALSLYDGASETLSGNLNYKFQYVKLPGLVVDQQYTHTGNNETICEGTIGWSMTAGVAQDGPSNIDGVKEGMTQDNEGSYWNKDDTLFGNLFAGYPLLGIMDALSNITQGSTTFDACQAPKPTFLDIKLNSSIYLYTDTLPCQLFQIGKLALVGVPGEMTTMSARRLRSDLSEILAPEGVEHIVIAGLANAYSGYITTPEEYSIQYYAGGHTLFGPNTLAAYRQVFSGLASAIVNHEAVDAGPTPKDWSGEQLINAIGVVYDDKRLWESFGETTNNASSAYVSGNTAKATFRSGHPQNNFKTMDAFLKVQQKVDGNWVTILTENDISTEFHWIRDTDADCLACSFARLEWTISDDIPTGTYRLKHQGHWKSGWGGSISSYSGTSREFNINNTANSVTGVSLLGAHNKYVRAKSNGGDGVKADRSSIGSHETFSVKDLDEDNCVQNGDSVAVLTGGGNYFRATDSGGLDAKASAIGSWEKFTLSNHSDGSGCLANNDSVSLKSVHNKYMVAESNEDVNANRSGIGSWEKFTVKIN